jgi:VanZ family protein
MTINTTSSGKAEKSPIPGKKMLTHLPWMLLMTAMTIISSMSRVPVPNLRFQHLDKILHFTAFAVLGWLLCRSWEKSFSLSMKRNRFMLFAIAIIIGGAFAVIDEIHQSFVPGRDASVWDLLFDWLGIWSAAMIYHARFKKTKPSEN